VALSNHHGVSALITRVAFMQFDVTGFSLSRCAPGSARGWACAVTASATDCLMSEDHVEVGLKVSFEFRSTMGTHSLLVQNGDERALCCAFKRSSKHNHMQVEVGLQ
jgi:hypothetical protein